MAGAHPAGRNGPLSHIADLPARVAGLEGVAAERAARLLAVEPIDGRTDPPPGLEPWLERTFGSADAVREQHLVRVTNLMTLDSTVFAGLRSRRPMDTRATADLAAEIERTRGDAFCHPEAETPANAFGRVRGRRMVSGANAAMADAHHGVLVFDEHDPLAFDADLVADLLDTGRAWAELAREADPAAVEYLLIWNCLWRAGGSIVHGHAQVLAGDRPHARLGRFRGDADAYLAVTGASLIADLVDVHADLGLAIRPARDVAVLAHLTPMKEREILVVGEPGMDERAPAFADAVGRIVVAFRDRLGVRSFNLALWRPPLDATNDPMPPVVRLVDRGAPSVRPSDIGAMELYGSPIVGSDPYEVIEALRDLR
ncbi:MAG TPA: hypothetical protein VHR55_10870 [Candidatus Limnocylindria bacterium]|nr:hypothetical protein [Candidatus Limnocylindria bacterium]